MTDENKDGIEPIAEKSRSSKSVTVAFKLNGSNYSLWARLMEVAIGGRGVYRHITGIPTPPRPGEKGYTDWEEEKAAKAKMAIGTDGGRNRDGTGVEGNRETVQVQERKPEAGGLQTGGGQRGDGGEGRTAEAMVASLKMEGGSDEGGKGLGKTNTTYLLLNPHKFHKFQLSPRIMPVHKIKPQTKKAFKNDPQTRRFLEFDPILCKNSFAPLETLSCAFEARDCDEFDDTGWIFDCGATDTMTYDKRDFVKFYKTHKSHIQTANGGLTPVEGAGTIEIFPNVQITNCLYVPNLSQKLMSISRD